MGSVEEDNTSSQISHDWEQGVGNRRAHSSHPSRAALDLPLSNETHYANGDAQFLDVQVSPKARAMLNGWMPSSSLLARIQTAWALLVSKYTGNSNVTFGSVTELSEGQSRPLYDCAVDVDDFQDVRSLTDYFCEINATPKGIEKSAQRTKPSSDAPSSSASVILFAIGLFEGGVSLEKSYPECALILDVNQIGKQTALRLKCDNHEISQGFATSMASSLGMIIDTVVSPELNARLLDIDMCSERDKEQIRLWNCIDPAVTEALIHDLFSEQAEARPSSIAVSSWDGSLTYRELDTASTKLACYLIGIGVVTGSFIPLYFEKSIWMTVAVLSVLKAGGAVVPIDARLPSGRVLQIIKLAKADVVVTATDFRDTLIDVVQHVISDVESLLRALPDSSTFISRPVSPSDPALALFTSGSTGVSKGLVHTHASIGSSVLAYGPSLRISSSSRILQFSAYSFDISMIDTIASLIHGACLYVPSESERLNDLTGYIQKSEVNWAFLTPSFARHIEPLNVPSLTTLVLGGEPVPQNSVEAWVSPLRCVINGYGPAECGICVSGVLDPSTRPAIGRSVNCHSWVVEGDDPLRLMPLGCVGELLVEGPNVFQGYLNLEDANLSAFLIDPTWLPRKDNTKRRLYRTGDLVRYNPDGTLDYIGRKDNQTKIRGQRIELGEIEYQIRLQYLAAKEAAVVVVDPPAGDPILAAFVSGGQAHSFPLDLKAIIQPLLKSQLPDYMVPSIIFPLEHLPETRSHKIDRRKLQGIAMSLLHEKTACGVKETAIGRSLGTELEHKLADLWLRVLRLEVALKASDHFFYLGANSLSAIELVAESRRQGFQLSVAEIIQNPILADMALLLRPSGHHSKCLPFHLLPHQSVSSIIMEACRQCTVLEDVIEDIYPCTPLQNGVFALSLAEPGTYVTQLVYTLSSSISIDKFRHAWDALVEQSSILRSRIVRVRSQQYQVVTKPGRDVWATGSHLESYLTSDRQIPMDCGSRLHRFALVRHSNCINFVLTIHHVIYDGWSLELMWEEVKKIYLAQEMRLVIPFSDFMGFLKNDNTPATSKEYWRSEFEGSNPPSFPSLPSATYRPRTNAIHENQFKLSYSRSEVTLSIAARAAWALLMVSYTGSYDVTFGMTLSGRFAPFPNIENLIGPAFTTVPIRLQIDGAASIKSYLRYVQQKASDMVPYEHTGLQGIAEASPAAKDACAFSSLLVVQPESNHQDQPVYETETIENLVLPHALVVECHLTSNGLKLSARFDSAVMQAANVARMMGQFAHLLQQICLNPEGRVYDVELTSPADLKSIMAWNSHLPPAVDNCIHRAIELEAQANPFAQAVCAWDGTLTYSELDRLASHLANHLSKSGVRPEVIVPLCFDKSKFVIVSLLAVLKAGGACLFLEPTWPQQRMSIILDTVKASIVVAQPKYAQQFVSKRLQVITMSEAFLRDSLTAFENVSPPGSVCPSNASFVFFTSGSTGVPKGIVQEHTALLTSSRNHAAMCNINSRSRVLQFSAFTFDVYEIEIVTTLTHGGCVCIPSEHDRMNNLVQSMEAMNVNWAFFTPTFCRSMDPLDMPSLRTLLVGGEAVDKSTIDKWARHVRLLNCYGPAECGPTVMCELTAKHRPESIGMPICCASWIADPDDHDKLAPVGTVGELLLEGYTMARGYLDQADKTAASFVAAPPWLRKAGPSRAPRVYKTGDLVRYSDKGNLDYIGRKDTQVKVRGQRIELGEVEYHLRQCLPEFVDAAAETVKINDDQDRTMLIAYVCSKTSESKAVAHILDEGDGSYKEAREAVQHIRIDLQSSVPASMVPSHVLLISNMPMTSSGKLDRKQLRVLAQQTPQDSFAWLSRSKSRKTAPKTRMQMKILNLWSQILGRPEELFVESNFFHGGGDSIAAMSLVAQARALGLLLSVEDIFKHPSLGEMADLLEHRKVQQAETLIGRFNLLPKSVDARKTIVHDITRRCRVGEDSIEDIYPCTPLQEGLLALSVISPGTYISRNVYALPKAMDLDRFRAAWDIVIQHNLILRTRVLETGLGTYQAVFQEPLQWQETNSLGTYLLEDKASPMISGQPMVRLALFRGTENIAAHFVLTLHHCIYDGWSMDIIWKSVAAAYQNGNILRSAPFNRFIKHISEADLTVRNDFWRTQLSEADHTSFPRRKPGHTHLATVFIKSPERCRIDSTIIRAQVTLPTIVRAAWAMLISQYSMVEDVTFGVISNGRTASVQDIDTMAAPIITTVPVRVILDSLQSVSAFLNQVQNQAVEMIPHEHTGLQNIKAALDTESQSVCDLQNLLVIQPTIKDHAAFSGVECISDASTFVVPHALVMICTLDCEGVTFEANFDPQVLKRDNVYQMMTQLSRLIHELAFADGRTELGAVQMTGPTEMQVILQKNALAPQTRHDCVHDVIQRRAFEAPQSLAICSWDGEMTYKGLDDYAQVLAAHLPIYGVKCEVIVPVLFEKSKWALVAMLAVLKAGGAFVLIDRSVPPERLRAIFESIDATVCLTSREISSHLVELGITEPLVVDEDELAGLEASDMPVRSIATANNMAYVNFTSGTTSASPKAVVIEHQAIGSIAIEHAKAVQWDIADRILQFSSYNFDSAAIEILVTLMHGACVCIPSERERLEDIMSFMNKMRVTFAIFTPAVAKASLDPERLETLRTLELVGEQITKADVARYQSPDIRLMNGYGLTECSVESSVADVDVENLQSLGKTVGANYWVVDPKNHDRLTPIGTVGELLIEGPGLAREYLNDKARTQASFINNPAWSDGLRKMRLYKTGDLVRLELDGSVSLIGRKDMQAKIRGQRIDLAEIQEHLRTGSHRESPKVVCGLVTPSDADSKSLTAFVQFDLQRSEANHDLIIDTRQARKKMTEFVETLKDGPMKDLPAHMIPTFFVPVTHIPLLLSGKINGRKLVESAKKLSARQLATLSNDFGLQQTKQTLTAMESRIAKQWALVLGIEQSSICANDSFLLWGDSIKAIRLTAALRGDGLVLGAPDIGRNASLKAMAESVSETKGTGTQAPVEPFSLIGAAKSQLVEEAVAACDVQEEAIEDIYDCTPLQEGLMALSFKQRHLYIARNVIVLPASIDAEKFVHAWDTVVAANPILRTSIIQSKMNRLFQVVLKGSPVWYKSPDVKKYLEEDRKRISGFGALLNHFALLSGQDERYFVWTSHHATYDGWSVDLLFRQFEQIYRGESVPQGLPFNHFIKHLQTSDNAANEDFWNSQGIDHEVPSFPALPNPSYSPHARSSVHCNSEVLKEGRLDSTLIQAAWAFLSAQYLRCTEIGFGLVMSGRTTSLVGIESIVGPTITTVPQHLDAIAQNQTIEHFLNSVESATLNLSAFAHAGLQNIRKLGPKAEALCNFRNILVIQPDTQVSLPLGMTYSKHVPQELTNFNNYALMLQAKLGPGTLDLTANFDKTVIDEKMVERMLRQLVHIVGQMQNSTREMRLRDLGIATSFDLQDMQDLRGEVPVGASVTVQDLVSRQCKIRGSQTAIQSWDGELTYTELEQLSNNLADHLMLELHVKSEAIVPLYFERSMWTVVALLAVLKAGGAVILLDAAHPLGRVENTISETGAELVICDENLATKLHTPQILRVTSDYIRMLPFVARLHAEVEPSQQAFILSTSGSTGKPKLMIHSHAAFCNNVLAYEKSWNLSSQSRVMQFAAYSFDISVNEMIASLTYGGCLCIPSEEDRMNDLAGCFRDLQANWLFSTPSFLRQARIRPESVPSLKTLALGGEAIGQDDLDTWKSKVKLITCYGPAECQICTIGPLEQPRDIGVASGCVCWIVDPENVDRLVPFGMPGELVIQGPGVILGYLNAPNTPLKVSPAWLPAGVKSDDRLFRTGDIIKVNPRGSMTYLGRIADSQVKLRGQRIDLDGIEYHLRKYLPSDLDVAVDVVNVSENLTLVAFITASGSKTWLNRQVAAALVEGMQSQLADTLPRCMVPSGFVLMDFLPLTVSGKTDRKSLKSMGLQTKNLITAELLPHLASETLTGPEQHMRALWAEVLQVHKNTIGAQSNFFRLGGDSISAIRLVNAGRDKGLQFTVADAFEAPKLCDLAKMSKVIVKYNNDPGPFSMISVDVQHVKQEAAHQCAVNIDQLEDLYPCTPLQQGLFALSQKSGAYVARSVFKLPPDLDMKAFKAAWSKTASLNAILRTAIVETSDHGLLQAVLRDAPRWETAFSLDTHLMMSKVIGFGERLVQFAIAEDRYFILSQHHASYDGYSLPQIFRQAEDFYQDVASPLSTTPFNRFVKHSIDSNTKQCYSFWAAQMAGATPSMFPLVESGHQPVPSSYLRAHLSIDREDSAITMSSLVRAAWALIVCMYAGNRDVTFGATVSGRQAGVKDIERIIGPTICTVPVHVRVNTDLLISDFLQAVQQTAAKTIPFEQAGLQNIKKQMMSEEASTACDFQNILIVHPETPKPIGKSSIHIPYKTKGHAESTFRTYALNVECSIVSKTEILAEAFFDPKLIQPTQMQTILDQFQHVLSQLAKQENHKLSEIDLVSPQDLQRIQKWNAPIPSPAAPSCIHTLISQRAALLPDRPAICSWDGELNYSELEELSSRLAYHLSAMGIGPKANVLLCFEKSLWMAVAMAAVMKAGGGFVPLDPSHPRQRLLNIVDQIQGQIILASSQHHKLLADSVEVNKDTIARLPEPPTLSWSNPQVYSSDMLYTMFTSGSTGDPKGVEIQHQAFCAGSHVRRDLLGLNPHSRVLQFSSYSFDVSMEDMLSTLLAGGCICIPREDERLDDLAGTMKRLKVNHANLTPSVASLIRPDQVPDLKVLALGGEALTQANIQTWANKVRLINSYGPTEASVYVIVNPNVTAETSHKNIGHAVGCTSWVVDPTDHNKLAPIHTVGELLVEGPALARGYLHDVEKTRAAFIENPKWAQEPKRLYKTGDLVRYSPDGSIMYLGRVEETQVKIHGQRVELGEIEHHLRSLLPDAKGVFVNSVEQNVKATALTAFVNLDGQASFDNVATTILREATSDLRERLPPHMVPTVFVPIHRTPLTSAGKIDRRQLQASGLNAMSNGTAVYPDAADNKLELPSNEIEERMLYVWSNVLNIPLNGIGVSTPFFNLGGDSISAIQVVSRCRAQKINVSSADIMQFKTISKICKAIEKHQVLEKEMHQDEIETEQPFALSPIQREHFLLMPDGNDKYQQSFLLRLTQPVTKQRVDSAIACIVKAHPMLRSRFVQQEDGQWMQQISKANADMSLLRSYSSDEGVNQMRHHLDNAIDIRNGPTFAAGMLESGIEQMLYLAAHHLIIDLVSWRIILQEVEELLRVLPNSTLAIPKEPLTFSSWSRLQYEYSMEHSHASNSLQLELPRANVEYWGMNDARDLYEHTTTHHFVLDEEPSSMLLGKSCNEPLRTEPVEIFLAALCYSFNVTFSDHGPLALFNEGHGREPWKSSLDLSRTVGWFTTMFPICTDPSENFINSLVSTKDTRRSIPRNGWPFFTAYHLNSDATQPLQPEAVFNYHGSYQQLEREDALLEMIPIQDPAFSRPEAMVKRPSVFEISVSILGKRIRFDFVYNRHIARQIQIWQWVQECENCLLKASKSLPNVRSRHTRSDFSLLPSDFSGFSILEEDILTEMPSKVDDIYPCSPMQRRMLHSQLGGSQCYQAVVTWKATEKDQDRLVDVYQLQRAWQQLVDRHELLRTCVLSIDGQALQIVLQKWQADITFTKAATSITNTRLFEDVPLASQALRPMHRMTFAEQPCGDVICTLEIHHALMDGASIAILLKELTHLYSSSSYRQHQPLEYKHYIQHLRSNRHSSITTYWQDYVEAIPHPCKFPTTTATISTPTFIYHSSHSLHLDLIALAPQLHPFCKAYSITLTTLFHTAWALLLRRFTRSNNPTFGYLISGRSLSLPGIESAVGPYFRLLPCHLQLDDGMTMRDVMKKADEDNAAGVRHGDFALPEPCDEGEEEEEGLFNTVVNFRKYAVIDPNAGGRAAGPEEEAQAQAGEEKAVRFEPMQGHDPFDYDIVLGIAEHESDISIVLTYWRSRISDEMAARAGKEFVRVLERLVGGGVDARIGDI